MFKVTIDNETTELNGKESELLVGLCLYIKALHMSHVDINKIQNICDSIISKIKAKEENNVKVVYEDEHIKVKEAQINPKEITKEEFKKILNKLFEK